MRASGSVACSDPGQKSRPASRGIGRGVSGTRALRTCPPRCGQASASCASHRGMLARASWICGATWNGGTCLTSSPANPLADLYARLEQALAVFDWFLFGARAAIHYGSARATVDVDVSLRLAGASLDSLVERAAARGFTTRITGWRDLADRARVLLLIDQRSGIEVDVVLTGPGLEDEFHSRARKAGFGGVELPVIAPEDLLISKLLAGRPQDLQDVEAVLAAQPDLDLARVRSVLGRIEAALGRSDLKTVLERLQSRVQDR